MYIHAFILKLKLQFELNYLCHLFAMKAKRHRILIQITRASKTNLKNVIDKTGTVSFQTLLQESDIIPYKNYFLHIDYHQNA